MMPGEFDILESDLLHAKTPLATRSHKAIVYLRGRIKSLEEEAATLTETAIETTEHLSTGTRG
jgi:hypothetical protein